MNGFLTNNGSTGFWLSQVGAALITGMLLLAYACKPSGATELQSAPWQTLLFIDHSNQNL